MLRGEILDFLYRYVEIILRFEKLLTITYKLSDNPYQCQRSFPRTGTVKNDCETFNYRFHGGGCSFDLAGIEVRYDYIITDSDYITTSPWKFWRFVISLSNKSEFDITNDTVENMLKTLASEMIIKQTQSEYLLYQVGFSWFERHSPRIKCLWH